MAGNYGSRPPQGAANQKRYLYFAYGSNLCLTQMYRRCPGARAIRYSDTGHLATVELPDYQLEFYLHADVRPAPGQNVVGGLYSVTKYDLEQLDRYEGVSAGYYRRAKQSFADLDGTIHEFIFYEMCGHASKNGAPTRDYFQTCVEGYREWDIPLAQLESAQERAMARTPKTKLRTGDLVVNPFVEDEDGEGGGFSEPDERVEDLVRNRRSYAPESEGLRRVADPIRPDDSNDRYKELLAREQKSRQGGN